MTEQTLHSGETLSGTENIINILSEVVIMKAP